MSTCQANNNLENITVPTALKAIFVACTRTPRGISATTVIVKVFFTVLALALLYFIYRYRRSVKKKRKELQHHYSTVKIYRCPLEEESNEKHHHNHAIHCMELHPTFIKSNRDSKKCKMMSLGQYLSTLTINNEDKGVSYNEISTFLKKELQMTLGSLLLKKLGNTFGAALLPIIGTHSVDSYLNGAASKMASWCSTQILKNNMTNVTGAHTTSSSSNPIANEAEGKDASNDDIGTIPLTLTELSSVFNINHTSGAESKLTKTPLEFLQKGEVDMFEHDFTDLVCNPFCIEKDFDTTIYRMEKHIRATDATGSSYDPNDNSIPPPSPINSRVLPDLHLGYADVCMSHTQRECLSNRLACILLTRLSFNYYLLSTKTKDEIKDEMFVVNYNGTKCLYPDELLQALIDNGHTVDCCPRTQVTNFGVALSVKESDGSWKNIPTAIMLKTGLESLYNNDDKKENQNHPRPATFCAAHGGIDFYIRGPIVGTTNTCAMQFYIAYQGLCAFHCDHDVILPFKEKVSLAEPYSNEKAVLAARLSGLMAVAFSAVSTEMNLPLGGYGIMGICNDVSGFIDFAVNGKTAAFPLFTTGRYMSHLIRCMIELKDNLKLHSVANANPGVDKAVSGVERLIYTMAKIDSDLHLSPSMAKSSIERYRATYPQICFQETADSMKILDEIYDMYKSIST